jgi:hypothetical protein
LPSTEELPAPAILMLQLENKRLARRLLNDLGTDIESGISIALPGCRREAHHDHYGNC